MDNSSVTKLPLLLAVGLFTLACNASADPTTKPPMQTQRGLFKRHLIAAPAGQGGWGGKWAVTDENGREAILIKLWTGAGSQARKTLLWVDAATGKSEELIPPGGSRGNGSHSTYLSRKNRLYDIVATHDGPSHFYEFDVSTRQWLAHRTLVLDGIHRFAHSFIEDDSGKIYAGILGPGGGLLRFDPETGELNNLGRLLADDWLVYPHLMTDSAGWVYAATAHKEAHIVAYSDATGFLPLNLSKEVGLVRGAKVFRGKNGRAYIQFNSKSTLWFEAYEGQIKQLPAPPNEEEVLTNRGWRPWNRFESGTEITSLYVSSRVATLRASDGSERTLHFDYPSRGIQVYSLCAGDDGKVYGSTGIPLRFFAYDPATNQREHFGLGDYSGHINDMIGLNGKIYGAIYGLGQIIEVDPTQPWTDAPLEPSGNPHSAYRQPEGVDYISRPLVITGKPGGDQLFVGGLPYRVAAGGGLLIYNLSSKTTRMIPPGELVPEHGLKSLAILKKPLLAGGSSATAGTGGKPSTKPAEVFLFNTEEDKVVHRVCFPKGTFEILDLVSPDGETVIGIGTTRSPNQTFAFRFTTDDPTAVQRIDLTAFGTPIQPQGSRVFSVAPNGDIYLLFREAILLLDQKNWQVSLATTSPAPITVGSAWVGDRLFFASLADLWSWTPPKPPANGAPPTPTE